MAEKEKTKKEEEAVAIEAQAQISQADMPPAQRKQFEALDLMYAVDNKGRKLFLMNSENIYRVLQGHPDFKGRFRYDVFKNKTEMRDDSLPYRDGKPQFRQLQDADVIAIQREISVLFEPFRMVTKTMVFDALMSVFDANKYDSAVEYLRGLKWDGVARLDSWLCSAYGVANTEYHRTVGSNWMKGLVKRIVEPGCKFDHVLVLEGPQGSRKSTSLFVLGGDWHLETAMGTESKDFFMQFQGKAIVEFSEGETLSRTEVKRMKAIITTQIDTFRPPYERTTKDFPRRCVFAMTTNQDEYLKDETGNRRWLPVRMVLDKANIDWLTENRDQLYAEAYHRVVEKKETVWEFPEEDMKREQAERTVRNPNAEVVADWFFSLTDYDKAQGVTIHQAYKDAFGITFNTRVISKFEEMSMAGIFRDEIGLTRKQTMVNGVRCVKWYLEEGDDRAKEKEGDKNKKEANKAQKPIPSPVGATDEWDF